jgi:hypothetical protein
VHTVRANKMYFSANNCLRKEGIWRVPCQSCEHWSHDRSSACKSVFKRLKLMCSISYARILDSIKDGHLETLLGGHFSSSSHKKWRTNETAGYDGLSPLPACSDQGWTAVLNKVQESIEGVPLSLRFKLLPGDRRDNSDSSAKTKCTRGAEKRSC